MAGGTACGKTTLCKKIYDAIGKQISFVSFDSFYISLTEEQRLNAQNYNFDDPKALNKDEALECLKKLLRGEDCSVPVYDFSRHQRKSESENVLIKARPVIIFEGIFALYHQEFRDIMDLKIFVLA